jgi:hypothetical protein
MGPYSTWPRAVLQKGQHVTGGLQEAAARRFDEAFSLRYNGMADSPPER